MRTFITILSIVGVLCLGWQYRELADRREVVEARAVEVAKELESARTQVAKVTKQLEMANARIAQLRQQSSQPAPKPNWVQERIRNRTDTAK